MLSDMATNHAHSTSLDERDAALRDPAYWADSTTERGIPTPNPVLTAGVRLELADAQLIGDAAEKAGVPINRYLLQAAREAARRDLAEPGPPDDPPSGLPVVLWTRWNFDQEPMVAPNRDGFACYSAWLQWDGAATPIMAFADGETYALDRGASDSSPDHTTYWTGVPGHRRDHALEEAAERAGWRRQPNEGETDETY